MWQIYSRQMPYLGQNQHVVIFGVVAYNLRPNEASTDHVDGQGTKDDFDDVYKAAYAQSWDTDPKKRPCAKDLVMMLEPYVVRCD